MGSKLTIKGIRWILREMEKKDLSVGEIAKQQGITPRWVRQRVGSTAWLRLELESEGLLVEK